MGAYVRAHEPPEKTVRTRRKTSVHRCPPLIRFLTDHPLPPYIHHSPNYHSLLPIHSISLHHSITLHHLIPSHNSTPLHSIYLLHHPPRRITFSTTKTAHDHSLRKTFQRVNSVQRCKALSPDHDRARLLHCKALSPDHDRARLSRCKALSPDHDRARPSLTPPPIL